MSTKYIFVTGGVVSGLGKGITAAVLGGLLKARGLSVRNQKLDQYINVDPALMSPIQHGEIFVTEDGSEMDVDIGHYERFTEVDLNHESDITSGMVYRDVIERERAGGYNGRTVQIVPHITNELKEHMFAISRHDNPDVCIVEIGGTVGDMEGMPFLEAIRQVSYQVGRENCIFLHLTLLPYLKNSFEIKTKPTQHSVQKLLSYGIQPDILVCRTEVPIDQDIRDKLALFCNVPSNCVIENIDMDTVYALPLYFEKQGLADRVCQRLGIAQFVEPDLSPWEQLLDKIHSSRHSLRFAITGKYVELPDAYYSVMEALEHACIEKEQKLELVWVDSDGLEDKSDQELEAIYQGCQAILVPGGFGPRGTEGMIRACQFARERKVPFLGLGLGMQMAVVEIARNLAGIKDAHSDECEHPCSDLFYYHGLTQELKEKLASIPLTDQPMRRGGYPMTLQADSLLAKLYGQTEVSERHHHRREFNSAYQGPLLETGLSFAGSSPDGQFLEAIEWPDHPFYVGLISHPEFKSRPLRPHPVFRGLVEAALQYRQKQAE